MKEQIPIENDRRRWRALAQAGVLTTGLLLFPFALRPFCGHHLNWKLHLGINAVACACLIYALLAINYKKLRPAAADGDWGMAGMGCYMLAPGLLVLCYQNYERDLYERSPGCVAEAESDASLSPCTWLPMRLDRKISSSGGVKSRSKQEFCLTDAAGAQHLLELPNGAQAFNLATEGETLEVQTWRGSIVQVRVRNVTAPAVSGVTFLLCRAMLMYLMLSGPILCAGLFVAATRERP